MSAAEHGTRVRSGRRDAVRREANVLAPVSVRTAALHLTVLWSLAVAQPLFDVLDDDAEFFVARGSERADILIFAFALVFLAPAVMTAAEAGLRLVRPTLAHALHSVLVTLLAATIAVQVLRTAEDLRAGVVLLGALGLGVAAARLYARRAAVRSFLTVLAPAPIVFLALFLSGPVGRLVWEDTSAAATPRPVSAEAPVVFVVLDELPVTSLMDPGGSINARRFPNFARLASGSTWFRNTTTVHAETRGAVPAILTGRLPRDDALPVARDHPDSLFTLFGASYRVDATEAITRLCPREICRREPEPLNDRLRSLASDTKLVYLHALLPESIADGLPHVTDTWVDFRSSESEGRRSTVADLARLALSADQRDRFESFVYRQGRSDRRTLRYLHLLLPHTPFTFLPSGERYERPAVDGLVANHQWGTTAAAPRVAQQRHLLQVGFTDRLLGRLLAKLRARGVYDESAIVVVADHGASFRPGQTRREPTDATLSDIAFVPFFLKAPHQRSGRIIDRHVRTVDVLPTLADALGIDVPWRHDGRSALGSAPPAAHVTLHEGNDISAPNRALLRRRTAAIEQLARAFGTGGFDARFYALGGHAALVGAPVRATGLRSGDLRVELDRPSVPPRWATGRLTGAGAREGVRLAVAVGGRIAGTATTHRAGDEIVFALMLAPGSRATDASEVRVYRIEEGPLRLQELRAT